MTEESPASPPQGAPEQRRRGLQVPTWVATLVVGLIVFGIAFAVGRATDDHGEECRACQPVPPPGCDWFQGAGAASWVG